jgi:hypothetical protein
LDKLELEIMKTIVPQYKFIFQRIRYGHVHGRDYGLLQNPFSTKLSMYYTVNKLITILVIILAN